MGGVRHCENRGKVQSCSNAADEPALPESGPLHAAEPAAERRRFRRRQEADESGPVEIRKSRDRLPGSGAKQPLQDSLETSWAELQRGPQLRTVLHGKASKSRRLCPQFIIIRFLHVIHNPPSSGKYSSGVNIGRRIFHGDSTFERLQTLLSWT